MNECKKEPLPAVIPGKLLAACRERGSGGITLGDGTLSCSLFSADEMYFLDARTDGGEVVLRLCDDRHFPDDDGIPEPLVRREPRDADWPAVLDDLCSAGDEFFGLLRLFDAARRQLSAAASGAAKRP